MRLGAKEAATSQGLDSATESAELVEFELVQRPRPSEKLHALAAFPPLARLAVPHEPGDSNFAGERPSLIVKLSEERRA